MATDPRPNPSDPNVLPDLRPPEDEARDRDDGTTYPPELQHQTPRTRSDRQSLQRLLIGLLVFGLLLGVTLAIGVVWGLNQMNLLDPAPSFPPERSPTEQFSGQRESSAR